MNKCLSCGKDVKNKYCNTYCQNQHQSVANNIKKYGEFKSFVVVCYKCEKEYEVIEREKLHPQKEKYYCSSKCSHSHIISDECRKRISESLKRIERIEPIRIITECKNCGKEFQHKQSKNRIFCSKPCNTIYYNNNTDRCSRAGLNSCKVQKETRRSKNEIYLSELCMNYFNNVLVNEQMFNGWDADIILNDQKIAILWNGKWHYKKIKKEHSVEQVQNRDKIKIKEIEKLGYEPYIIKDMGKFNKDFVDFEFEKLKKYMGI